MTTGTPAIGKRAVWNAMQEHLPPEGQQTLIALIKAFDPVRVTIEVEGEKVAVWENEPQTVHAKAA